MPDVDLLERRFTRERTARKEAESLLEQKSRELYEANQRLIGLAEQTRSIVETAAEGIITYRANGQVTSLNRSARRLFGYEDPADVNVRQLFDGNDACKAALFSCGVRLQTDSDDGLSANSVELVGVRRSGETFSSEVSLSCVSLEDTTTFTALVRDMSKRRFLESRLRQAQKMESVGRLAAGIAHEVNTPIQFVSNNLQFLEGAFDDVGSLLDLYGNLTSHVRTGCDVAPLIAEIDSKSELVDLAFLRQEFPVAISQSLDGLQRVASIIRAMKDFSQPSSGTTAAVDLNRLIEKTLAVSVGIYRDVAEVTTQLDEDVPLLLLVEGQISQVLMNLLSNAVEAITRGTESKQGVIRFSTTTLQDAVHLQVEDNGCGISADAEQKIFDPFYTTKDVGQGTGQGLSFVYDVVVNSCGGDIRVESAPGEGSTFTIVLPRHRDHGR